jgi:hypothetical protein
MTTGYETEIPGAAVTPAPAAPPAQPPAEPPRRVRRWPLVLIGAPAAVAVWSGWVGLGGLCGFGPVHLLPGIDDGFVVNTAITLPIGVEAYGAYALGAWLRPGGITGRARRFARGSAIGSLALGMAGQVIYHLLAAAHATRAPWPVVMLVSCLPVVAIGFGAALVHLLGEREPVRVTESVRIPVPGYPYGPLPAEPVSAPAGPDPVRAELAAALAAASARTDEDEDREDARPAVDRDALVAEIADAMHAAIEAGERYRPPYADLMERTGRRRSWCEKVVGDARRSLLDPPPDRTAPSTVTPRATPAGHRTDEGARTDATRTDETPGSADARTGEPVLAGAT